MRDTGSLSMGHVAALIALSRSCALGDSVSMLQRLRDELKAIQDWDNNNFPVRTLVELAAVPIREARKMELIRKIRDLAARN